MPVDVESRGANGETYLITLDKTGSDVGYITIRNWKQGHRRTEPPNSTSTYNLYQMHVNDAGAIICKADVAFLPDPVVACWLDPNTGGAPVVRIQVGVANFVYPVSLDDFNVLARFLRDAHFLRA